MRKHRDISVLGMVMAVLSITVTSFIANLRRPDAVSGIYPEHQQPTIDETLSNAMLQTTGCETTREIRQEKTACNTQQANEEKAEDKRVSIEHPPPLTITVIRGDWKQIAARHTHVESLTGHNPGNVTDALIVSDHCADDIFFNYAKYRPQLSASAYNKGTHEVQTIFELVGKEGLHTTDYPKLVILDNLPSFRYKFKDSDEIHTVFADQPTYLMLRTQEDTVHFVRRVAELGDNHHYLEKLRGKLIEVDVPDPRTLIQQDPRYRAAHTARALNIQTSQAWERALHKTLDIPLEINLHSTYMGFRYFSSLARENRPREEIVDAYERSAEHNTLKTEIIDVDPLYRDPEIHPDSFIHLEAGELLVGRFDMTPSR